MAVAPLILFMDRYHLGDVLFLQALARALATRESGVPLVLCHGSGEVVERLLEGRGLIPRREDGRLIASDALEAALFDRGMRETARKITGLLTDAVVAAVAISGADRGLLNLDSADAVHVGDATWLEGLLEKQVVPVVSLTTRLSGVTTEVRPAAALVALADALGAVGIGFFARGGRIPSAEGGSEGTGVRLAAAADEGVLSEPTVAAELAGKGVAIYLVTPQVLRSETPSEWTPLEGGL